MNSHHGSRILGTTGPGLAAAAWATFALGPVVAAPRSAGPTEIDTEILDSGGGQSGNATLTHTGSLGGIIGLSSASTTTAKQGFVAQLYEVQSLQVTASPATVDEDGTRQISAALVVDDDSLIIPTAPLSWSVLNGPLSIDSNGIASGQPVYQSTPATVRADFGSRFGTLSLDVLNKLPDNFGSYAGDSIDDDWQVFYFGENNPLAGPTENPDFDPTNNLIEFLTGYDPTDDQEHFRLVVTNLVGTTASIELSKLIPGTRYHIQRSTDLGDSDPWTDFSILTTPSESLQHTILDSSASGSRHFYRVGFVAE